jgi:hypothetical protein
MTSVSESHAESATPAEADAPDPDRENAAEQSAGVEAAPPVEAAAASDAAERAPADGETKSEAADRVGPSFELDGKAPIAEALKGGQPGSAPAIALPGAERASPLGEALAALDRRDYATARRLFVALGRKDAAEAIDHALAALDRKDYATAQGLFEALKPSMPAASPGGPTAFEAQARDELKPVPPLAVIPTVAPGDRAPSPRAEKKRRGSRVLWLAACLALVGIAGAAAFYRSGGNGAFAAMKSQAIATLAAATDSLKTSRKGATAPEGRSDPGGATGDQSATPTQTTERPATGVSGATPAQTRLDRLERETAARFDALGERSDPNVSTKLADLAARLDALEKKAASTASTPSAAPSADLADIAARLDRLEKKVDVAATPATQVSDLTTRLDRLEKKAAALVAAPVPAATLASAASGATDAGAPKLPPSSPSKRSTLVARTQPTGPSANARPDAPRRLLQEYSVEAVQGGVAVVDGRYGAQQVGPGDFIPGAGRVLRIERHNGDWYVLTSGGVIASGPPQYDAPY